MTDTSDDVSSREDPPRRRGRWTPRAGSRWLRRSPRAGWLLVTALVAVTGCGLTLVISDMVSRSEVSAAERSMDRRSAIVRNAVVSEVRRYADGVTAVAAALSASDQLDQARFAAATEPLMTMGLSGSAPAFLFVSVADDQTAEAEAYWRARGAAGLRLESNGQSRDHAFSVFCRVVDPASKAVTGTDLSEAIEPSRALEISRATGETTMSDAYVLVMDRHLPPRQQRLGVMFAAPVYAPNADGTRGAFRAWAAIAVRGPDLVEGVLRSTSEGVLDVVLRAVTGTGQPAVLAAAGRGEHGDGSLSRQLPVMVADHTWTMRTMADPADLPGGDTGLASVALRTGTALALLIAALVYVLGTARGRAEAAVIAATAELRAAESRARGHAELLTAVMDGITDGVTVTDEQVEIVMRNQAAIDLVGPDPSPADPSTWAERCGLYRSDGVTPFPAEELPVLRVLAGEQCRDVEMVICDERHPDGLWVIVNGRPVTVASGTRLGLTVMHDITERKRAERKIEALNARLRSANAELELRIKQRTTELNDKAEALRAANDELEAFAYSVSHDLRAPLRAISGFSAVVLEEHGDDLPEAGRRYLQKVRKGAADMERLIHGLLEFSRTQRQAMESRAVDLDRLVESVWDELAGERQNRSVELEVRPLPVCLGDVRLLRQVMVNLLSNALKYTRNRQDARIEIGSHPEGVETVYFVRDNGVGFDMTYANKLFTAFQRLHRSDEFEGIGIGLALTARVVRRHGGRIWADAAVDEGATFLFTLPTLGERGEHGPVDGAAG